MAAGALSPGGLVVRLGHETITPYRRSTMQDAATTEFSGVSRQALARLYEAFAQGDIDTVMATLTEDIERRVNRPSPVAGTYRGKEAVLGFFSRMMAPYEGTLRVDVVVMLADDHHGLVRVAERAERPGDGVEGGFKWSSQRWLVEAIVDTR
jgi:ketosteroid isomerase-like protein